MKESEKKVKEVKTVNGVPTHGVWGIGLLFTCFSIGYANYVVYFGTSGLVPKIMLIPSTLFVIVFLVIKAIK